MKVVAWPDAHMDDLAPHAPDNITFVTVSDAESFLTELVDADAAITHTWADDFFQAADDLAWVQATSAGVDHLPLDRFTEHDIAVTTASGVHPEPIAEHVYGALLGLERDLFNAYDRQRDRRWEKGHPREVAGSAMLIVGVGAIGAAIAEKAAAFDVTVHGVDPDQDCAAVDTWHDTDSLHDALPGAEYVVIACPLTEQTRNLIGQDALAAMDTDAVLVNIARGRVVDEGALLNALQEDAIRAAVLDVFHEEPLPDDHPFWSMENVLVTPHNSGRTPRYEERLMAVFRENLDAFRNGEPMPTRF